MPFTEIFSTVINEKEFKSSDNNKVLKYTKMVKVLIYNDEHGKNPTYWVDIRTHCYNGVESRATKFGVCITPNELNTLLPNMIEGKEIEIDGEWRRIWFKKSDKKFMFDLCVRKYEGKDTTISVTNKDIKKINFIRDKIFIHCKSLV